MNVIDLMNDSKRLLTAVIFISGLFICNCLYGQKYTVQGKITDAQTGASVPYATVSSPKLKISTATDFEGRYKLVFPSKVDSIVVSFIGYARKYALVSYSDKLQAQLDLQISPNSTTLNEITIVPKSYVNPAWRIMRQVISHKTNNDYSNLRAYQYESYNRIELHASNFNEKLRKKKSLKQMRPLLDSLKKIAGKEGTVNLPIFVSESYSENFFKKNPFKKKEHILKTRVKGLGFEDGTLFSQLVGSTFLQHNFYKNNFSVVGKEFISPISDHWKMFYNYKLVDRDAKIDTTSCYKINFHPKSKNDLAFIGTIWIAKNNYALCQISAVISPEANLNFIDKVEIQQESSPFEGIWFPTKSRILVKIDALNKNTPGLIAQFYLNNHQLSITAPKNDLFFKEAIVLNDSASIYNDTFWKQKTPPNLTLTQQNVFNMIDTLNALPAIKTYIDVADMVLKGYYKIGNVSIGPYIFSYARNDVEGNRFRMGFKTNYGFSKKWIIEPYVAYGDRDERLKYGLSIDYILSRKPWTQMGISYAHDINQVALLSDNYNFANNNLFAAFSRFGPINRNRRTFLQNKWSGYIKTDLVKNLNVKLQFENWSFTPLYHFVFFKPHHPESRKKNFITSALEAEINWTPGIITLQSESKNKPVTIKSHSNLPAFHFRYTLGLKGILNSDLNYQKISFNISQKLKMGILGKGEYSISAGIIPSIVPYPILENHLGNTTFFYNKTSFNTMRFFEFMSDNYASLMYTQHFEGLFFNRIPFIKKFNLRGLATCNMLYGTLSAKNRQYFSSSVIDNTFESKGLNKVPYLEMGYGIENIFKLLRVDFIHRLNYLDNYLPKQGLPRSFAVKLSVQIRL